MGKLDKAVAALKRQASSIAEHVKKKRKSKNGSDSRSTISITSSKSSNYQPPSVEDVPDEDDVRRASTADQEDGSDGDLIQEIPPLKQTQRKKQPLMPEEDLRE
ncbi:hypothetical protein L226DRAFT_571829 [Lentinus tigrinus ALCF2SS1-7]|uniref:Uncharacterized protein n=1 Tax=Lentinus tigrinus ALCF2SS1-6 TaxID=1328759 RepID=A0A5C2RKQ4_9APHY|nr:hypothetical protein L227DRAFT_617986 [Lentinus tigrinus ALCF2SS1-6]RPD73925.1 hypothetical protein L226DRAFT_571829 [Lentinus tigrinus ALCF2SS1-7]